MRRPAPARRAHSRPLSAGCGGAGSNAGPVNIVVRHGYTDVEGRALSDAAKRFNVSHPAIHVSLQNYGNADLAL